LGLDFIPVVTEQYDVVIPDAFFESSAVQTLLGVVSGSMFKDRVTALGGYDTRRTGEVLL
jgi:putative molybdopterin biosynthesis protein